MSCLGDVTINFLPQGLFCREREGLYVGLGRVNFISNDVARDQTEQRQPKRNVETYFLFCFVTHLGRRHEGLNILKGRFVTNLNVKR